jgi:putative CocE/NonD family hydrolase
MARYFASRGYAVVAQDTRGRHKSEGIWHLLTDDGRDGVDTLAWIAQQPWSNGSVGMYGTSYAGGTQHAPAMEKAPELKTVIPVDAMSNFGYQSIRNGGAFELRWWNWMFIGAATGARQTRDPATKAMLEEMNADKRHYLLHLPFLRDTTPMKHAPEYEDWLVHAMQNRWDGFWTQNNIRDNAAQYKDACLPCRGWYDSWEATRPQLSSLE